MNLGDEAGLRETADDLFRKLPEKLGESETDIGSWEQIEKRIKEGYADAVYGTAVVEYKAPGLLKEDNSYTPNQKAIDQTRGYLEDLKELYNWPSSMLTGLVTDGKFVINVPVGRDAAEPTPVNSQNLEPFLRRFRLLSQTEPFDAGRVKDYFGKETKLTKTIVQDLFRAFQNRSSEQTDTYYNQWEYMFSVSHGSTGTRYLKELEKSTGVSVEDKEEAMELLFCLYTYVVIVVKMIATNLIAYYSDLELQTTKLVGAEGEDLRKEFRHLEEAKLFEEKGIKNFSEGNFFSWYIYEWNEISDNITELVETVGKFNPQSLANNPEETHDLLKGLYQDLVPRKLRHKLGEFYTPDWLAERTLNLTNYNGDTDERVLDPGCGSGTFLVEVLRRVKSFITDQENSLTQERKVKIGKKILKNIAGYDLNPVAVLAARTNFILAMGDIFKALINSEETIDLPVYLCDSILTPRLQAQLSLGLDVQEITEKEFPLASDYDVKVYEIRTTEGSFPMPVSTVKNNEVSELTNLIEEGVKNNWPVDRFWETAERKINTATSNSAKVITSLYEDINELADQKRDDIWPRIIKNGFAQVMQEKFDLVVGNPPWVNWENLPQEWQEKTEVLWDTYGLFSLEGHEARMGGGKKDLSMLFTYTCADKYLKSKGKVAFVITQTLFKTQGAGDGFRRFQLGDNEYIKVEQVDDLIRLKPFEGVSNRTAISVFTKSEKTNYPVTYQLWKKKKRTRIPESSSLEEVKENYAETIKFDAKPVDPDKITSPWITAKTKALDAIQKAIGESDYRAREGANTGGANGVYWLSKVKKVGPDLCLVENDPAFGRKDVDQHESVIENDLVFPLLRGKEVNKWKCKPNNHLILAQNPDVFGK